MLRTFVNRFSSQISATARRVASRPIAVATVRSYSSQKEESDAEFDARYESYFNNPELDGWALRKGMNDIQGYDLVPEPKIIAAALRACRRVNDVALAVRYLEAVQDKCGNKKGEIWPYLHQELKPTLEELGIPTPEELGYDKPELAMEDVYDIH